MPLTKKGKTIRTAMHKQYGNGKGKGERVFHASRNAGRIKGVEKGNSMPCVDYADAVRHQYCSLPRGRSR